MSVSSAGLGFSDGLRLMGVSRLDAFTFRVLPWSKDQSPDGIIRARKFKRK